LFIAAEDRVEMDISVDQMQLSGALHQIEALSAVMVAIAMSAQADQTTFEAAGFAEVQRCIRCR